MRSSSRQIAVVEGRLRPTCGCHFRRAFAAHSIVVFAAVIFCTPLLRGQSITPDSTTATAERTVHGIVKSGNMPIPGAGISTTNTETKQQVNTWTDVDGSYRLRLPSDGHYTLRVQMAAFAAGTQEVVVDAAHQEVQANFELILLSRAREARIEQRQTNAGGRGFQSLSVFQSGTGQDAANGSMN